MITDDRPNAGEGPYHQCTLNILSNGSDRAIGQIIISDYSNLEGDVFNIDGVTFQGVSDLSDSISSDHPFLVEPANATTASNLVTAIEDAGSTAYSVSRSGAIITITASDEGSAGELDFTYTDNGGSGGAEMKGDGTLELVSPDKTLYNSIKDKLKQRLNLYPSGAMAGIYATVDRQRGVWKAPANVSINRVIEPVIPVSHSEQMGLNVDATSGKSINAIRHFSGKGTMVWGARTLAGNDNEWRYIPVRRLFIFIEESVKKATEFVVFEPNDAKTWLRVKTMIENFLSKLWRDGALAGATPGEAFFVKVGLGQTMTPLDILEGRMNVEIGLAAVRPAEFIILKFSHKLQES